MGWADTRQRARRTTHKTFSLPAFYTPPGGSSGIPCNARMHNEKRMFGDLDREGFALNIEDVNQVIFDSCEVVPKKNGRVTFPCNNTTFNIVNILPKTTDEFMRVEVTLA